MAESQLVTVNAAAILVRAKTVAELSARWGGWRLDGATFELAYPAYDGGGEYQVDLEQCCTSAQAFDWIMQVIGKTWATDDCIAGLVRALDDILDPQDRLCSGGANKKLNSADVRRVVKQLVSRHD